MKQMATNHNINIILLYEFGENNFHSCKGGGNPRLDFIKNDPLQK